MPTNTKKHDSIPSSEDSLENVRKSLSQSLAKLDELGFDLAALRIAEALELIADGSGNAVGQSDETAG